MLTASSSAAKFNMNLCSGCTTTGHFYAHLDSSFIGVVNVIKPRKGYLCVEQSNTDIPWVMLKGYASPLGCISGATSTIFKTGKLSST